MKITIKMDRELLDRVVKVTGARTKTEAIHKALRESDRRCRLVDLLKKGAGISSRELKSMFDPESDPERLRVIGGCTK